MNNNDEMRDVASRLKEMCEGMPTCYLCPMWSNKHKECILCDKRPSEWNERKLYTGVHE